MLRRRSHAVEVLGFDNETIAGVGGSLTAAASAIYSIPASRRVSAAFESFRPELLHVHNSIPTLSPSVFFSASGAGVPVVQTLHNYRLICANAQLFRAGQVCELCVENRSMWPGVRFGCYRGSRLGSAVVGGSMAIQSMLGTWERRVARYIALSEFAAAKLSEFRLPREKIRLKPNSVPDRGTGEGLGGYGLFVGRLSEEKGLETLLTADRLGCLPMPVRIAGDGPLRGKIEESCARQGSRLVFCGSKSEAEVQQLMKNAMVLLVPSLWYEGFPMVMVEAMSLGLPVLASCIGGLPEIVEDGVSGMLHKPGDAEALLHALREMAEQPAAARAAMRAAARARYLDRYAEQVNYAQLMKIYAEAIQAA